MRCGLADYVRVLRGRQPLRSLAGSMSSGARSRFVSDDLRLPVGGWRGVAASRSSAALACSGFEWRIVAFGACRPEHIFCRGLTPLQFHCRDGFVLEGERCVRRESAGASCAQDEAGGDEAGDASSSTCVEGAKSHDEANCTRVGGCRYGCGCG